MINRKSLLCCLTALSLSHALNAAVLPSPNTPVGWRSVISFSIGPAWSSQGSTQTLFLQSDIFKTYVNSSASTPFGSGELFFAGQRQLSHDIALQIGLVVGASGDHEFTGEIWEDGNSTFNNYTYQYYAQQIRFAAKAKLSKSIASHCQIYTAASLGLGLNRSHDYTSTPRISQAVALPNFTDNTHDSLSYSLELGVQKTYRKHWVFGAGYQFIDWGKLSLARAPAQTVGTGVKEPHLYSHSAQFTLSYLA